MEMKEYDLTTGSISKKLIRFAMPLLATNVLQSIYSIVDMLVVGRVVGKSGLAAISNASLLTFIINSICIGITLGGTVLIAQYKGAKDSRGQKETIGTLLTLSLFLSIIVTVLGLLVYKQLFILLNVPQEAMRDAIEYMQIICIGTVFVFGYNAVSSIMKGLGNSKSPLYFVGIATIINIILDVILVGSVGMGTKGAAYATIFAQAISLVISINYLKRKNFIFDFKISSFKVEMDKVKSILNVGFPTAIQMVIVNVSFLIVTGMLNNFGTSVVAATGIGLKINTLAGMPCWAIGQAVTTMVGQNMGAKDIQRVKDTTRIGLYLNIVVTLLIVILVQLLAEPIILLFDPFNKEVLEAGVLYLKICCSINSLIYATMYTFDSFAIGIGKAKIAMTNALLDTVIVRLPACWLLGFTLNYGFTGIYFGEALSPILPAIVGLVYFKSKQWEVQEFIKS